MQHFRSMMGTTDRFEAGARIGDYVVDRELPTKPGLVAYSAKHALLPRRARILSLHPVFAGLQTMSLQLMREACILEALRHPGVPRVYECGLLADRRPWVATELIEGPTVASLLEAEGRLSVPAVLGLLADISEILHHVHARGCVHRNLRPEVIARRPEGPCILDWADARGHESDGTPTPLGSPETLEYQPPEVVAGEPADRRADVFALGAVAYEALAGARSAMSAARRFPGVPPRLSALIDRMLAPDPLARPTSAEVRAEALRVIELSEVPLPPPPSEDDAVDVQIEDVELHGELADYGDADAMPPPREARLRWTPPPRLYQRTSRTQTRTMQPASSGSYPAVQLEASSRTKTEEMPIPPELSRTQTEAMPVLPPLEPSRRKSP